MLILYCLDQSEEGKQKLEALKNEKKEIQTVISYSNDLIKLKESQSGKVKVSMRVLTERDNGKLAQCFFESEQQWFAGKLSNVDVNAQTAVVDWIGYSTTSVVPSKFIKIAKHPDPTQLAEGYF